MNLPEAIQEHTCRIEAIIQSQDEQRELLKCLNRKDGKGDKPTKRGLPDYWAEASVKLTLVLPFIHEVLGYDVFNLSQVVPEYPADIGYARGTKPESTAKKIDYALMCHKEPLLLIECKSRGGIRSGWTHAVAQGFEDVHEYFSAVNSAKVAVYTNGIRYVFYSDCEKEGTLDKEPFLAFDWCSELTDKEREDLTALVRCLHANPTPESLRECACQIKKKQPV